jgi:ABC-2 type transport system ATP-binding protein
MTTDQHVIAADGLRRRYSGGFEAVRGVSFSVRRGEIFALLGTNGAGKTSTVELLEGLTAPAAGTVRVLGHDPYRERAAVRPRIGVMLQEGGFPSDLTVTETARMWAGCTSGARPVGEALELVGLAGRASVRVKQLSGGERRRLDLALALLGRPEVLFLDEPTTGLDAEGRRDTWDLVRALRDTGTTVLLTTHYLEEAESLADRLAIMHRGVIVTSGTPAGVTASRPARIRFVLPEGVPAGRLPLPLRAAADGPRVEIRTHALQDDLGLLLRWAQEHGVRLEALDARTASLEEAFLEIASEYAEEAGAPGAGGAGFGSGPKAHAAEPPHGTRNGRDDLAGV